MVLRKNRKCFYISKFHRAKSGQVFILDLIFSIIIITIIFSAINMVKGKIKAERDIWMKKFYLEKIANNWIEKLSRNPGVIGVSCQPRIIFTPDMLQKCIDAGDCLDGLVSLDVIDKYNGSISVICEPSEHGFVFFYKGRVRPYVFFIPKITEILCNETVADRIFSNIAPYFELGLEGNITLTYRDNGTICPKTFEIGNRKYKYNPRYETVTVKRKVLYKGGKIGSFYITVAS